MELNELDDKAIELLKNKNATYYFTVFFSTDKKGKMQVANMICGTDEQQLSNDKIKEIIKKSDKEIEKVELVVVMETNQIQFAYKMAEEFKSFNEDFKKQEKAGSDAHKILEIKKRMQRTFGVN